MAITDERAMNALLYDLVSGRRFMQDSPIMPDVWTAFAAAPTEPHDLILSPTRDQSAPDVAKELRNLIYRWRRAELGTERLGGEEVEVGWPPLKEIQGQKQRPRLTSLQGRIAVTVYFDELMRIVLAMTPWWQPTDEQKLAGSPSGLWDSKGQPLSGFPDPTDGDETAMTAALVEGLESARTQLAEGPEATGERQSGEPTPSVRWVVRLAGSIGLSAVDASLRVRHDTAHPQQRMGCGWHLRPSRR